MSDQYPTLTESERTLLKVARKERRKQVKEQRKKEKQCEKEKLLLEERRSKDNRINLISKELAEKLQDNLKHSYLTSTTSERPQTRKHSNSLSLEINLVDAIIKNKPIVKKEKEKETKQYDGNILDSSMPERKRGKHRIHPKKKKPTKLKVALNKECSNELNITKEYTGIHNSTFQIYCDNCISQEFNNLVKSFLEDIVKFQNKLYKKDPIKGVAKRRYVVGFHETRKYLKLTKVSLLIIAPNIKITNENGILNQIVEELKCLAISNEIPCIFALSRNILKRVTLKNCPVSCIAILDFSGAEEKYKSIIELSKQLQESYKTITGKQEITVEENETEKMINILL